MKNFIFATLALCFLLSAAASANNNGIVTMGMGTNAPLQAGLVENTTLPNEVDTVGGFVYVDTAHPVGGMVSVVNHLDAYIRNNMSSIWKYDMVSARECINNPCESGCGCG